jgi:RNA polymerase sigma factor (sigma-70 family)
MLTVQEQHKLIKEFMPLAKKMAISKKRQCLANISISELVSASYFGLVDAASRYEYRFGTFWNFATIRIAGALQDYMRELGFGSKGSNSRGCSRMQPLVVFDGSDQSEETSYSKNMMSLEAKSGRPLNSFFEELVEGLDEKGRTVLRAHFVEEQPLKQIGTKLGVTEGRVSQLISKYRKELLAQAA